MNIDFTQTQALPGFPAYRMFKIGKSSSNPLDSRLSDSPGR